MDRARRRVLMLGAAAPVSLMVGACSGDDGADEATDKDQGPAAAPPTSIDEAVEQHLTDQLGDAVVAASLTPRLVDAVLTWKPPTVPYAEVDSLVVYAFGNRVDAAGKVTPGPMNEQLAAVVAGLVKTRAVPVYAQWEVAEVLADRHSIPRLVAIEAEVDANGQRQYLTTADVADKAVKAMSDPSGKVGVIGWYDHAKRCVDMSIAAGLDAAVPAEAQLPTEYDPGSGQEWTRSREAYILHDIPARLATTP